MCEWQGSLLTHFSETAPTLSVPLDHPLRGPPKRWCSHCPEQSRVLSNFALEAQFGD